eukprot:3238655-Rhodomonas_salina.3
MSCPDIDCAATRLPTEEADYLAEETGLPAPLFHIVYEDTAIGVEDLEEHEGGSCCAMRYLVLVSDYTLSC